MAIRKTRINQRNWQHYKGHSLTYCGGREDNSTIAMFIRHLRLIAKTCIAAVLFAQLAVAAYACPAVEGPAIIFAAITIGDMHAAMPGCEMTDIGNPNLCLQHCQAGDQSVQTLPHVEIPAFAAIPTLAVIDPLELNSNPGITILSRLPERETSPPPLIRFGVLRI